MAPDNVDRGDVVADVLARGVPRRAVVQIAYHCDIHPSMRATVVVAETEDGRS